ncbi:hypothetical protein LVO79_07015 [Roseivivax marinus]|uniref:hypothetical protein n=1 Tax=Roseivivax marinus TaxID=1379903 RepID=UPI001F03EDCD|nr:hypothetical protein [Roseivivax marinus]UMA66188.1 hypothetical protein LVO79_07015 [Roseivivax marinus]
MIRAHVLVSLILSASPAAASEALPSIMGVSVGMSVEEASVILDEHDMVKKEIFTDSLIELGPNSKSVAVKELAKEYRFSPSKEDLEKWAEQAIERGQSHFSVFATAENEEIYSITFSKSFGKQAPRMEAAKAWALSKMDDLLPGCTWERNSGEYFRYAFDESDRPMSDEHRCREAIAVRLPKDSTMSDATKESYSSISFDISRSKKDKRLASSISISMGSNDALKEVIQSKEADIISGLDPFSDL